MAKTSGGLFSLGAHGTVAKVITYQGGSVRKHLVQHNADAQGQITQRGQFRDVTRILKAGRSWLRTWWRAWLGKAWFTGLSGLLLADHARSLADQQLVWSTLEPGAKELWSGAAPVILGMLEPGKMFFCVARTVWGYLLHGETTPEMMGLLDVTNAILSRLWWLRTGEFTYYTDTLGVKYTDQDGNFYVKAEEA